MLQGKEPSYRTVMALLRCTEPWSAHYAGSSSSGGSSSEAAVQSEVGRLAQGRRGRQDWSAKEEEKLAAAVFHASKRALEELRCVERLSGHLPRFLAGDCGGLRVPGWPHEVSQQLHTV